ncbi:MAG: aldehyde dehydrogenase family protein [Elusimicrobiota bacterium]|nr:aldehyde dehydrogenase family protein [Elusimicrobiota bacterium]
MNQVNKNYINGKWQESRGGTKFKSINPADTTDEIGTYQRSTVEDVNLAFSAAESVRKSWSSIPATQRGELLFKAANILEKRLEKVAAMLTREMGKTFTEAKGEVLRGLQLLQFYGGEGWRMTGTTFPSGKQGRLLLTLREPLGVVCILTPWNFPFVIPLWKIGPALVYGNTVVFKPANLTPQCGLELTRIIDEAGFPHGVFNFITGTSSELGDALVTHPAVNGISFTGSCATGAKIALKASGRRPKLQLEMGGQNPLIVMEDADLDQATDIAINGSFWSTGQKCTATGRIIVQEKVHKEFAELMVKKTKNLRVGNGMDTETQVGPMVSEEQLEMVLDYVEVGKKEGAKLLCGGGRLEGKKYDKGYFIEPTIFGEVKPKMRIAQEEVFGPFVCILKAKDLQEALDIANDSRYGLSGAICTRETKNVLKFVREIGVGLVHVNNSTAGAEPHVPFGGMKDSTSYFREMGRTAIEFFTQYKTVYMDAT